MQQENNMAINVNQFNQHNNYGQSVNINVEYSSIAMQSTTVGTGHVGKLIPIFIRELIPSQKVELTHKVGIQFMPFVSNVLHNFSGVIKTYFVPYRLIDENWEDFIQGGVDGQNNYALPYIDLSKEKIKTNTDEKNQSLVHTILDYMGYPINGNFTEIAQGDNSFPKPMAYPVWAYNKIYNDHIRPIDVQPEEVDKGNIQVLQSLWQYDYFTRARVYQQRGNVPLVPVTSATTVDVSHKIITELGPIGQNSNWHDFSPYKNYDNYNARLQQTLTNTDGTIANGQLLYQLGYNTNSGEINDASIRNQNVRIADHQLNLEGVGINLNSLYTQMGIMSVLINNAKIRYMYIDWLEQRFGVKRQDARLQMAEYIDTQEIQIGIDTITQTSYGDAANGQTPQGYITAQAGAIGTSKNQYTAQEHGILVSILEITPASVYEGGLQRMLMTKTRYEFPMPELANMPDRPIYKGELFYTQTAADMDTFGYVGIYDEYRTLYNNVVGLLRPSTPVPAEGSTLSNGLHSYTLARYFTKAPSLNLDFLQCNPDMQRILQYTNEPDFLFIIGHNLNTAIPLPLQSNPAELLNL